VPEKLYDDVYQITLGGWSLGMSGHVYIVQVLISREQS